VIATVASIIEEDEWMLEKEGKKAGGKRGFEARVF